MSKSEERRIAVQKGEKVKVKYIKNADYFITPVGTFSAENDFTLEVLESEFEKLENFIKEQLIKLGE